MIIVVLVVDIFVIKQRLDPEFVWYVIAHAFLFQQLLPKNSLITDTRKIVFCHILMAPVYLVTMLLITSVYERLASG